MPDSLASTPDTDPPADQDAAQPRSEEFRTFQSVLREVFQFDVADLDFGIYRILNEKRDQIEDFITDRLHEAVTTGISTYITGQTEELRAQIEAKRDEILDLEKKTAQSYLTDDGEVIDEDTKAPVVQEYLKLQNKLEAAKMAKETEKRIYADLAGFFRRFYDDGDFISQHRFRSGESTYAIPYDGEEVVLHWANRDQYYVKTTEHFKNYAFEAQDYHVEFQLVDAESPKDNVKESDTRYFVLHGDDPVSVDSETKRCTITVAFRVLTDEEEDAIVERHNEVAEKSLKTLRNDVLCTALNADILDAISDPTLKALLSQPQHEGDDHGRLYTHLRRYTRKNTSDYFVHKDLHGFLSTQLKYYIQSEVLQVDDVLAGDDDSVQQSLDRARVVKDVGDTIITFLAQIEDFQKRLFEKKKFVLDTGYCVTLDRVPDDLYDTILDNDAQLDEWRDLYAVEQWDDDLFSQGYTDGTFTRDFLKANPHVMVDTRHFDQAFTDRLLAHLSTLHDDGLAGITDGLCIQGENFQALNLLQERYREKVDCVYIDPPYNTGGDGFLYKDSYQHSSWMSMMADRLHAARTLMPDTSVLFANVDDNEQDNLRKLLASIFGDENFVANVIWQKKYSPANDATWFSDDHDHVLTFAKAKNIWRPDKLPRTEEQNKGYSNPDNDPRGSWLSGDYTSNKSKDERPNTYYSIENPNTGEEIWPSEDAVWRYSPEQHQRNVEEDRIWWGIDGTNSTPRYKRFLSDVGGIVPKTIWTYEEVGHNQDAFREQKSLFGQSVFSSPKPVELLRRIVQIGGRSTVLDYFAGSGTTGHAVMEMNRDDEVDGDERTYILAEMGDHFDNVLLPRLKKVAFTSNWSDGVPQDRDGLSHVIQYHRLESYDDALNNIQVDAPGEAQQSIYDQWGDYEIRYMLDNETKNSQTLIAPDAFDDPFGYTLQIQHGMQSPSTHTVDLEATFNYLIGCAVRTRTVHEHDGRRYVIVTGSIDQGDAIDEVLIIWRSVDGLVDNDDALKREKAWIESEIMGDDTFDAVYANVLSYVRGADPIDIAFRERMAPSE